MLEKTIEHQRYNACQNRTEHPFKNTQISLNFVETIIVIRNRLRGRLSLFFGGTSIPQSVINFNNHCTHDYNIGRKSTTSRFNPSSYEYLGKVGERKR